MLRCRMRGRPSTWLLLCALLVGAWVTAAPARAAQVVAGAARIEHGPRPTAGARLRAEPAGERRVTSRGSVVTVERRVVSRGLDACAPPPAAVVDCPARAVHAARTAAPRAAIALDRSGRVRARAPPAARRRSILPSC